MSKATAEEVKQRLLEGGCWPFVKQRPYDVIANPEETPKAIFISGYNSAPLAPDADYLVEGKERELQAAIDALGKLTSGKIHLTIGKDSGASAFSKLNGVELHKAYGPHPVGNVSTQIAKVDPINKGERIWVVKPEDLVTIGDFLLTGKLNLTKLIAVNGGQVENPKYVRAKAGAKLEDVLAQVTIKGDNNRIIKGNPISGEKATAQDYVGAYTNQVRFWKKEMIMTSLAGHCLELISLAFLEQICSLSCLLIKSITYLQILTGSRELLCLQVSTKKYFR